MPSKGVRRRGSPPSQPERRGHRKLQTDSAGTARPADRRNRHDCQLRRLLRFFGREVPQPPIVRRQLGHVWGTKFRLLKNLAPKDASDLLFSGGRDRRRCGDLTLRCRIVLAGADGESDTAIAARLGVSRDTVRKWRNRFVVQRLGGLHRRAHLSSVSRSSSVRFTSWAELPGCAIAAPHRR
jgi:DNA-binding CsgD family transcriptional regulator